jgi:AraC-like DNA-binding protein
MSLQLSFASAEQAVPVQRVNDAASEQWLTPEGVFLRLVAGATAYERPSQTSAGSEVLDRLGKALSAAGFAHARRLALIAELLDTPASPKPTARALRPVSLLPKWRLKRVVEYVEAHISEEIKLVDMALASGMSRMYFASQFRAATGLRPHEYILRKRIERAQHILFSTTDSLVDVALSVGFQTQSHFTTVFKRIVGTTPYQWRRDQMF